MLYIVLFLVAAALAGVVAALITADSLWAWISIGLSVLAGLILLIDWFRRRSGGAGTAAKPAEDTEDTEADKEPAEDSDGVGAEDSDETIAEDAAGQDEGESEPEATPVAVADDLPGEEETDAADLLIVSELDAEVLVVDESPRYHLAECGWLAERDTIPLPISEARELGFSPCARCGPDATLAAKHRDNRKKFRSRADG